MFGVYKGNDFLISFTREKRKDKTLKPLHFTAAFPERDRERETGLMATSTMPTRRRLTPEEERKRDEQDQMVTAAFALSHFMFLRDINKADDDHHQNQPAKKRKIVEEDDSEETLELLLRWNSDSKPKFLPEETIASLGRCSKPIRKQLTESDVKEDQNRLMLGKVQVEKNFLPFLKESEIPRGKEGIRVSVYGPDGIVHEMMFKMWVEKIPVLTSGWNKFVATYGLKMHCDFLTVSMFRHTKTRKICFAIDSTRLPIKRMLRLLSSLIALLVRV
ncbi:unnamed protein product [Thlaspi arvense]|uniref:TF-B3 domain-containing protein n=1 Tax=Thlaspi arvense TaxID=13288 RepID=A0AAU9S9I3_THLAR|nr:unnamed protein product [Thlaspi arvense]